MSHPPHKQAGFTLLEMLIAISLLTLLAGLAYGTLRMGIRSWEAADQQADQGDAMRVSWPYLHRTLETTLPMTSPAIGKQLRFYGQSDQIQWVSRLPSHLASGGPRLLWLHVHRDRHSGKQQLRLTHHNPDSIELVAEENQQAVLVDRLETIRVQYFGAATEGGEPGWQATWQQRDSLPSLVRVDVQPSDGEPWPSLYAQLRFGLPETQQPDADADTESEE